MELRRENERLREALTETTLKLAQLKVELERATQVQMLRPKNQLCWGQRETELQLQGAWPWLVGGLLPRGRGSDWTRGAR